MNGTSGVASWGGRDLSFAERIYREALAEPPGKPAPGPEPGQGPGPEQEHGPEPEPGVARAAASIIVESWIGLGCVALIRGDREEAEAHFRHALLLGPEPALLERLQRNLRLLRPQARPVAIFSDEESFVGEALRELSALGPKRRQGAATIWWMALPLAFGAKAVRRAVTVRIEDRGPVSRVGVAAGAAVISILTRRLQPRTAATFGGAAAAVGLGWLATRKQLAPMRRRMEEHLGLSRRSWRATRAAWLDGKITRDEREARMTWLLERLCLSVLDDVGPIPPPSQAPASPPAAPDEG